MSRWMIPVACAAAKADAACWLNEITSRYDGAVVCAYDLNKFSAAMMMDVLRTHPMVVVGRILQENPFYIAPSEFLQELQRRRLGTQ